METPSPRVGGARKINEAGGPEGGYARSCRAGNRHPPYGAEASIPPVSRSTVTRDIARTPRGRALSSIWKNGEWLGAASSMLVPGARMPSQK